MRFWEPRSCFSPEYIYGRIEKSASASVSKLEVPSIHKIYWSNSFFVRGYGRLNLSRFHNSLESLHKSWFFWNSSNKELRLFKLISHLSHHTFPLVLALAEISELSYYHSPDVIQVLNQNQEDQVLLGASGYLLILLLPCIQVFGRLSFLYFSCGMMRALLFAPIISPDAISRVLYTIPLATTIILDSDLSVCPLASPIFSIPKNTSLQSPAHTADHYLTVHTALPPFLALSPALLLRHRGWRPKSVLCIVHC